ncbi:imm11 family protein [Sorangium sp. So ce131]|uniref:imm11 family protein n=1 Tax=Sorangium sp. So ce131 TaxID=3133282 RepID=UPI003F61353C
MRFYVWTYAETDPSFAWIDALPDGIADRSYLLNEGEPCVGWFPADEELGISDDYGIKLPDAIPNTVLIHVISQKMRVFLEDRSGALLEFLPVRILDKKRRPDKRPYHVMNLLGSVACVDRTRSEFDVSHVLKDQIARFRNLSLDETRIGPDAKMFRLADMPDLVLVREDLVAEIQAAGCTGITFQRIEDYGSEYRDLPEADGSDVPGEP